MVAILHNSYENRDAERFQSEDVRSILPSTIGLSMEVELRQVILRSETGCIICSYNGQLIFASSHPSAVCSLLSVRSILVLQ